MGRDEKTTKDRIHESATREFLEKGFRDASLRSIAGNAGVTTGSFYWHYKSKEELYDALVGEHYSHILQMYDDAMEAFRKMGREEQKEHMGDIGGECMVAMVEYMYEHLTEFKLLLTSSSGTKYENLVHELTQREIDSTHEFERYMEELGYSVGTEVEPELEHSIISGMFEGLLELVFHDVPKERAIRCVRQLHMFYTAGWKALMGI